MSVEPFLLLIADRTTRIVIEPCPRFEPRFEPWDLAIHYGVRLTFWPGNYIWSFSHGFGVVVRDIWEWRPGFYTEFRYKSYEHSGLAWGAILRKVLALTLFLELPCSFFQEHVPRMDFFPKHWSQKGAFQYFQVHRSSKWLVLQYFQVHESSKWLVFQYFQDHMLSKWFVF